MPPKTPQEWNDRYREGTTPWDSGLPSRELRRVLDEVSLAPGRALELGCGTGTNAVLLAERGFEVTAVDVSELALETAREKAAAKGVGVEFLQADVFDLPDLGAFDFLFDRGCYHCLRTVDLGRLLETVRRVTQSGTTWLDLSGNANEETEHGPPRVRAAELCSDVEPWFEIKVLREFRFEDPGGVEGPLGWSTLMIRRPG